MVVSVLRAPPTGVNSRTRIRGRGDRKVAPTPALPHFHRRFISSNIQNGSQVGKSGGERVLAGERRGGVTGARRVAGGMTSSLAEDGEDSAAAVDVVGEDVENSEAFKVRPSPPPPLAFPHRTLSHGFRVLGLGSRV